MRTWIYENRIYFLIALNFMIFFIPMTSSKQANSKSPDAIKEVKEKIVVPSTDVDSAAYHVSY
jgi:hypothetical protein